MMFEVHLEEDLEKAPEAASEQRYARDAEEVPPVGGRNPGKPFGMYETL